MEELQKNTEPEDSKEELNTSEGIAQELLKTAKKQLFYTRLSTCFVGVMAAAIVISLFFSCSEGKTICLVMRTHCSEK